MTKATKAMIASAAVAGLLTGSVAIRANAGTVDSKTGLNAGIQLADEGKDKDKHDCKGKNDCKGKGGCKSGDNGCKGKNSCKGKGGCNTSGKKKDE